MYDLSYKGDIFAIPNFGDFVQYVFIDELANCNDNTVPLIQEKNTVPD